MKDQFIRFPIWTEVEFHSESFKLAHVEGSALVGTEFVGWFAPNCQREVCIVVLPDGNSRGSMAQDRSSVGDAIKSYGAAMTTNKTSLLGWRARIADAVREKRLDEFQRIDRLHAYRYVPIPFGDDVRIVASRENEGHAALSQGIGQRKHHLALHVDIEYRAVQTAATFEQFHGTLEALGWSYILDGQARKRQRDVVGRQELVLDHQNAPISEGAP